MCVSILSTSNKKPAEFNNLVTTFITTSHILVVYFTDEIKMKIMIRSLILVFCLGYCLGNVVDNRRSSMQSIRKPHLGSLSAFHDFMSSHNKTYSSREAYKSRYRVFKSNMKLVERLQAMELGSAVYGATHLADLSPEEFRRGFLGYNRALGDDPDVHWPVADIPDIDLPDSWDWREKGAVSEVKNQGESKGYYLRVVNPILPGIVPIGTQKNTLSLIGQWKI